MIEAGIAAMAACATKRLERMVAEIYLRMRDVATGPDAAGLKSGTESTSCAARNS